MAKPRKIRNALKKYLEPCLEREGFIGRYPHFRRPEAEGLHLLSVLYDKWGGGFFLEFARHPSGPFQTSWGPVVPEEELEIGYANPEDRARLLAHKSAIPGSGQYFRYEEFADNREKCEELVAQVVELFPQVNAWLRRQEVGPNVSAYVA